MKSILVIGMGKFGRLLCRNLLELGNDLMIVDQNEECVSDLIYDVTNVQIGDCTNPQVVKSLGVSNFDMVIVCIGANFQNSLEITSLVKEMGAKWVISKANREVHAKFLLRNGADEVVYPDREVAQQLAKRCSANHVFDYIELDGWGIRFWG
jgi:trk system potassium uptake protein TrkA